MLEKSKKNKFKQAFYELTQFCDECELKTEEKDCPCPYTRDCDKFNTKFRNLYFDSLYPMHYCKKCPLYAMPREPVADCDYPEFIHHYNMRDLAGSELHGYQIPFSENKKKLLKNDSNYEEIFETEKQKIEFCFKSTNEKPSTKAVATCDLSDHFKLNRLLFYT